MNEWLELVQGTLEIAPELQVFVKITGAMFLLEIVTLAVALIGSLKGYK